MNTADKRQIVVFDFDGTLTTKDTLLEFIKFACGKFRFGIGFLLFSPLMVLMKLHLFPNWRCKQLFFSWFFKGVDYNDFKQLGISFADTNGLLIRENIWDKLQQYRFKGCKIYIVSASIEDWVRPFFDGMSDITIIGTKVESDTSGHLTGRFITKNCYGIEKVNRFLEYEPDRNSYCLIAFGDSKGDQEMLDFADKGYLVRDKRL